MEFLGSIVYGREDMPEVSDMSGFILEFPSVAILYLKRTTFGPISICVS